MDADHIANALSAFLDQVEEHKAVLGPALPSITGVARITTIGESMRIDVQLPPGAVYSDLPPLRPQCGTYCFPSGNFKPSRDLGWPLWPIGSHQGVKKRGLVDGLRVRVVHLRCRCRMMSVVAAIGPVITTVVVNPCNDGEKHVHDD